MGDSRFCAACGRSLAPAEVYHRFRLILEAEQDLEAVMESRESVTDLLARIEHEGDWNRYEREVHWERQGELCGECRRKLEGFLDDFLPG